MPLLNIKYYFHALAEWRSPVCAILIQFAVSFIRTFMLLLGVSFQLLPPTPWSPFSCHIIFSSSYLLRYNLLYLLIYCSSEHTSSSTFRFLSSIIPSPNCLRLACKTISNSVKVNIAPSLTPSFSSHQENDCQLIWDIGLQDEKYGSTMQQAAEIDRWIQQVSNVEKLFHKLFLFRSVRSEVDDVSVRLDFHLRKLNFVS
ncbi:uncharacterized protein LOC141600282 [Silene latifolia]|uniref:uncharacterized protein LOC141600282 n=1 Tax=Silene latifolia TaxID=37657 RepID=UPI003D76E7CC